MILLTWFCGFPWMVTKTQSIKPEVQSRYWCFNDVMKGNIFIGKQNFWLLLALLPFCSEDQSPVYIWHIWKRREYVRYQSIHLHLKLSKKENRYLMHLRVGKKEENILGNSPSIYIWGFTLFFEASELKGPICTSQLVALLLHLEVHILYLYFVLQSWWWSCNCILYLYFVLHSWWWSCNCIWYLYSDFELLSSLFIFIPSIAEKNREHNVKNYRLLLSLLSSLTQLWLSSSLSSIITIIINDYPPHYYHCLSSSQPSQRRGARRQLGTW